MWTRLIMAAAIFLQASPVASLHFYQGERNLSPGHQQVVELAPAKVGQVFFVQVQGSGAGDLDCYLLVNNRIISKDESPADMCYLGMDVKTNHPIKLWIVNNGIYPTKYVVRVER